MIYTVQAHTLTAKQYSKLEGTAGEKLLAPDSHPSF